MVSFTSDNLIMRNCGAF